MATKNKRSLEDIEPLDKNYKYILDDNGQWHRIGADDMTRTFEQLVVTPKGNKYNYVPKSIDNSEQGARYRDKMLSRQYTRGLVGEPGLELTYPELELLPLANIIGTPIKNLANNVLFNSFKGYNDIIDDVMKAAYYNAKFAEKPGTISKVNAVRAKYSLNPPKVKTNPLAYIKDKRSLLSSEAYYSDNKNEIVINPLTLLYNHDQYKGIIAHEATHAFKGFNPLQLSVWDKGPYYIPNPELGTVLKPFNRAASKGKWEGSPEELRAEMYNWKYMLDDLFTPYKKSINKKRYIKEAMDRFDLNKYETARILDALSNLGYF